jgi:hypothetical protein
VIHYQHPASLEAYYQEAGRAGRDGAAARCITLWSARDVALGQFFIRNRYPEPEQVAALLRAIPSENTPLATVRDLGGDLTDEQLNVALVALEEEQAIARDAEGSVRRLRTERGPRLWLRTLVARRRADYRRLDEVRAFLGEQSCVRARLLRHFGEELPDAHRCGNCSACSGRAAAPGRSERRKRVRGTASLWPAPEKAARRATPAAEPAPSGILWRSKQRAYAIEDLRARAVERRLGLAALALVAEAGEPLPPSGIANLLRGAARSSVAARQPRLVEIAGFGAGRGRRYADLLEDVLAMWAKGYLEAEPGAVPRLVLTPAGRAALDRARADR